MAYTAYKIGKQVYESLKDELQKYEPLITETTALSDTSGDQRRR